MVTNDVFEETTKTYAQVSHSSPEGVFAKIDLHVPSSLLPRDLLIVYASQLQSPCSCQMEAMHGQGTAEAKWAQRTAKAIFVEKRAFSHS